MQFVDGAATSSSIRRSPAEKFDGGASNSTTSRCFQWRPTL